MKHSQAHMQNSNLTKIVFLFCMLSIFFLIKTAFCQEDIPSPNSVLIDIETVDKNKKQNDESDSDMWRTIWGTKARDALLLGMWSNHLSGSGEYMGDGGSNEQNHLLGIQYYGLTAGTYINSHDDRAWFFGPAREVYSRKMTENTRFDIGYKFGPLYGYGDDLPNLGGISLFGAGTLSFSWHRLGVDIMIIPVGVITGGFRIDID
jgi:hypothetical protein